MSSNSLFHDGIADHAEVGEVTGGPQEDHLQALEDQHQLQGQPQVSRQHSMDKSVQFKHEGLAVYLSLRMLFSFQQFEYFSALHGYFNVAFHHVVQIGGRQLPGG